VEVTIVIVALIGYLAFRHWLQINRRTMIHRERLAALEKGVDLPPFEQEIRKSRINIQRLLLLAGLIWISLGIGAFVVLNALLAHPTARTARIPEGMQWIGVAPVCIGLSHVIVYIIGKKNEN
jgi:small-conductance mechanosensitive channel